MKKVEFEAALLACAVDKCQSALAGSASIYPLADVTIAIWKD